jgi:hypothetical protein
MALKMSPHVRTKLANKTPPVTRDEIFQCFANLTGQVLLDSRAKNQTDPPTRWFISETDYGRKLKVAYIPIDGDIVIKTAYDPDQDELRFYAKFGA